jgi:hypothetical protein
MLRFQVDELLIAEDVVAGVEKHTGNFMDETLLVGAVDSQYMRGH